MASKFIQDREVGKVAENFVIELLKKADWECEVAKNKDSTKDITAVKELNTFTFEVKFDRMSQSTANIALEYGNPQSQKLSGLNVSGADFWIYCVLNPDMQAWIVELVDLKEYIGKNQPFRVIDVGGDKNASLYLYKRDIIFNDIFARIDDLTSDELNKFLQFYIDDRNSRYYKEVGKELDKELEKLQIPF